MLIDTTLREGAQLFGAYFNLSTRKKIAAGLAEVGIDEIELGWIGQDDLGTLAEYIKDISKDTYLSVWTPCREADIMKASKLPIDRVNIGVPVSDLHIEERLGLDRNGLLHRLSSAIRTAKAFGIEYVSVGMEDVSRADPDFALTVAAHAKNCGASRIRLSDSLGQLTPKSMEKLIETFRNHVKIDTAVHCHDDFGMATANAVTALECGADYTDVSVLGIGERSGIAATEELAAYLALRCGKRRYSTQKIKALCSMVALEAGVVVPRTKAVVGEDIFACESGLHTHALSKSPELFEPYQPESVGISRKLAVGGKSGKAAVKSALKDCGVENDPKDITALTMAVRQLSSRLKRPLTRSEFIKLSSGEHLS